MALPTAAFLKQPSALAQLLEEINFQRTKEMRQLMKDDSGFVVLQGTTYWTDLFVRHFLFQTEPVHNMDSDDLLFFVRKKHVKGTSRHMPKFETEVDVYRKDSRKLPIGDPDVDWEETVYLNMVIHQFNYTLTLAICTRTSPKELQVLRRHSQRVYASPSRRKMDTKGENEEMTYPHICFMVDNFDEVFSDILVRDGEMVCVELVASDKDGAVQGVIFLGSIRYDALKKVYDARQSSLSSKVAQRMTFGLFSSGAGVQTRCEFVRMKGPQGKGHAEMAVTKPKGSGVETPTSEPGFCATEMWDEWEEDPDEYFTRHQRRLSDPSANLNNFSRYGWKYAKNMEQTGNSKARSENEGLDSLANEVSEIEAGDLRDDRGPASSASQQANKIHIDNIVVDQSQTETKSNKSSSNLIESTNTTINSTINTNTNINTTSTSTANITNQIININSVTVLEPLNVSSNSLSTNSKIKTIISTNENVDDKIDGNFESMQQISSSKSMKSSKTVEEEIIKSPPTSTGYCCTNCFSPNKCKRWSDTDSAQMSDVYSRSIGSVDDGGIANETPACLEKFPLKKNRQIGNNNNNSNGHKNRDILTGKLNSPAETPKKRTTLRTVSLPRSKSLAATNTTTVISTPKKDNTITRKSIFTSSLRKDTKSEKTNRLVSLTSIRKKNNPISVSSAINTTTSNGKKINLNKLNNKTTNNSSNISSNKSSKKSLKENSTKKTNPNKFEEYEIGDDVTSLNEEQIISTNIKENEKVKICVLTENDSERIRVHGKEELPVVQTSTKKATSSQDNNKKLKLKTTTIKLTNNINEKLESTINSNIEKCVPIETKCHPLEPEIIIETSTNNISNNDNKIHNIVSSSSSSLDIAQKGNSHKNNKIDIENDIENDENITETSKLLGDYNGNNNINNNNNNNDNSSNNDNINSRNNIVNTTSSNNNDLETIVISSNTENNLSNNSNNNLHRTRSLPGIKCTYTRNRSLSTSERHQNFHDKLMKIVPKHVTPDGTSIYYWCDLIPTKKSSKELDDGAYNPLWASRGFTQQFHFWKENRRQQSTPLNAFLTYVTLPWWSIAKDLLDHRETPILTF